MKPKILVVDDEKDITDMLASFLTLEGYEVNTVNDPSKVMGMLTSDNYMIVITDIMMPKVDGLDLIKDIKKFNGIIQVIVITGYVTMPNILSAFRRGASNLFFKPFENLDCILEEVKAIEQKQQRIISIIKDLKKIKPDETETHP